MDSHIDLFDAGRSERMKKEGVVGKALPYNEEPSTASYVWKNLYRQISPSYTPI